MPDNLNRDGFSMEFDKDMLRLSTDVTADRPQDLGSGRTPRKTTAEPLRGSRCRGLACSAPKAVVPGGLGVGRMQTFRRHGGSCSEVCKGWFSAGPLSDRDSRRGDIRLKPRLAQTGLAAVGCARGKADDSAQRTAPPNKQTTVRPGSCLRADRTASAPQVRACLR